MKTASSKSGRRVALRHLADRVLEAPDLSALTRLLTRDVPTTLGASGASLLLWDRRLETFEGLVLGERGRLRRFQPEAAGPEGPPARWLVSDGQLLETAGGTGEETLLPLLARTGLAGMLVLGVGRRGRCPVARADAPLLSHLAARAALALENQAYQKELIASERLAALGTMAGMLAHDFRGPMTVIRGYAETLLEESALSEADVAERARLIIEAVDRLERMATETLDFARGAERLVLRPVSVALLLLDLCADLEAELPGLEIERDIHLPTAMRAGLDVDKIRRTLSNICANARDAMGGRGRVRLTAGLEYRPGADSQADALVIGLADEGPGVPLEIRERVFQPFVTWGKKGGTGLGLAVARRFVEDHGGSLELLPEEPGAKGARFRLVLPLLPPVSSETPR